MLNSWIIWGEMLYVRKDEKRKKWFSWIFIVLKGMRLLPIFPRPHEITNQKEFNEIDFRQLVLNLID